MRLACKPSFQSHPALGIILSIVLPASAEVRVQPPVPITHRVQVQPIRVTRNDGITMATTFGDSATTLYIQRQVNAIWAQAGVRIDWLPFVNYPSNFAYQGSGNYEVEARPEGDLAIIVDSAGSPPKSTSAIVINMFFVEIAPTYPHEDDNVSAGAAFVDSNGSAIHVGANHLTGADGWDIIAAVAARQIGFNLGLNVHTASTDNLMVKNGGTTEYLTEEQKNIIFTDDPGTDGFDMLQVAPPTNYSQWALANGLQGGPEDDDDGDNIKNVIEFMLTLDPRAPSMLPTPIAGSSGLTWTLNKNPAAAEDGLFYQVQSGTNLTSWVNAGEDGSSILMTDNATTLMVRLNPGVEKKFMRFKVDTSPVLPAIASPLLLSRTTTSAKVAPAGRRAKLRTSATSRNDSLSAVRRACSKSIHRLFTSFRFP
ncbi:hypothetical protein [Luteolibacter luteus]|uniref:Uncharacterized protein n=1 Tax=Luteolibacter luteus TaxID=2728835 RepID=A0A858RKR0_9BACT|nr:hypothetical protein [Luteolibacter luteus]QJE97896.1 hypothetical protein HHL09_19595 [Luteolibacter luteus]